MAGWPKQTEANTVAYTQTLHCYYLLIDKKAHGIGMKETRTAAGCAPIT